MPNRQDKSSENHQHSGALFIVATPIGNLGDISQRAIDTLKTCDYIAVEDSRHSQHLLNHFSIKKPLIAYHDHNERQKANEVIGLCQQGSNLALISDAGTPLISDPGYQLVKLAHQNGIKVIPIPGACAAISALSASGLASDRFTFEGFLPAKKTAREAKLSQLSTESRTLIFYESTHRILDSLESMKLCLGASRNVTLAKEISKSFESIILGTFAEIIAWLNAEQGRTKGEFVILIEGSEISSSSSSLPDDEQLMLRLLEDISLKKAAHLAADLTGKGKNHFYQLGLTLNTH